MRRWVLLGVLLAVMPFRVAGYEVVSVYPERAEVATPVTLIGGPFAPDTRVVIGEVSVAPSLLGARQLVFVVPDLEPGAYALSLLSGNQPAEQVFQLQIVQPSPQVVSLTPEMIDECSDSAQRLVVVQGEHFSQGASVLLNNLVIPSQWKDEAELSFEAPGLSAGIYGVQVVNPDGRTSLPYSLEFSNAPEISDVRRGDDFVNSYQLVITGKNFFYRSILIVTEYPSGYPDIPPTQHSIIGQNLPRQPLDMPRKARGEELFYQDCHTLIYNRYPLSGEERRVVLRVSNPDGRQTVAFELFTP